MSEITAPADELGAGDVQVEITKRRLHFIIGALMLGMLLAALDQTVVSTALPRIVRDLHGESHIAWIVTAYLLSSTVTMPMWGKLGDQFGRKGFFQIAIVIFLIGSALSGLSHTMVELIVFRFLQGLGGGGLIIGTQTIVGDVVSPRERGRYIGLFMAMYGIVSVIGPMVGGLFVQYLNWRWIFYINLPLGALALVVTAFALPSTSVRIKRIIDYRGALALVIAASALVLYTSLGGTTYSWGSPRLLALVVLAVVGLAVFIVAERRAAEPVMSLGLFKNKVFVSASAIGFVIGFAMFGVMTFMPLFFQIVKGVSPTGSGFRLFPLMLGLTLTSISSGQVVSRWGRYKVFPVVGTALTTIGLLLSSTVGPNTGIVPESFYLFIFGAGLGLVMSILVVAVQNAVRYEELGAATSSTTFFRMIGSCFGAAGFGAVYANLFPRNLSHALGGIQIPKKLLSEANFRTTVLHHLPPAIRTGVIDATSHTVQTVFLYAVPFAAVAFLLTWLLPEVTLRKSIQTVEGAEGIGVPAPRSSLEEIEMALERVAARENRAELYQGLAERAHIELPPRACWMLFRLAERGPDATFSLDQIADDIADSAAGARDKIDSAFVMLINAELLEETGDSPRMLRLTSTGRSAAERLLEARRSGLTELLEGWDPESHPEIITMVRNLAHALLADDERLLADAGATSKSGA